MKRLFQNTTNANVLRGEFWTGISKSMTIKARMFGHDTHTFNWVLMFIKTNGVLDPAKLASGVRDPQTGYINKAVFEYIPWYLGYTGDDFNRIISAPYDPEDCEVPLGMVAAQLTLEVEKFNSRRYKKPDYLDMIEGKEDKDPIDELFKDIYLQNMDSQKEPAYFLKDGMSEDFVTLSAQLFSHCLDIRDIIIEELKGLGYSNGITTEKIRYFGARDIAVPMLTALFMMVIIQDYFKKRETYKKIDFVSYNNARMIRRELRKALSFECLIRRFWIAKESYSQFIQWERENYNTIVNNTEVQRSLVDLYPNPQEFLNQAYRYNDLGLFPETSLF